ncbi:BatD family protein [Methylomonas sp. LL1]|uniref:BatD family protein n=1 Tax=Methylomonas sp. LL1 TaxID=2785785 RepID=UPI001E2A0187|nr:BatD family protein [Methylomonas sp. LL1]
MLKNNRYIWLYWFLCGFLLTFQAAAAEIQVSVDRNPVNLSESFQITFSAGEPPDGSPDFAPLLQNFEILNQQRSSNVSWVNGKSSRNEQWLVSVIARQSGELLIPPIAFGADSSKPLKVVVNDAPLTTSSSDEVFLEVQVTPEKPYVQSQVLYTLKLYRRVQITQASLNDPEIKDAVVEKLGEDSTYSTQVKGMDYWVTERKYAIFPQQSGIFTIEPLTLTAEVVANQNPRFNGFFNRQITESRRVSSKAITLNVQPVPASFTGPAWLSAESLELSQSWSDDRLQGKVGEPLTRTIKLTAKGATVGQLPELAGQSGIDGIKTYPDQPLLREDKSSDGLNAVREEKIAYISSKPGEYTLPALTINWFNTKTQKTEVAHLAEVRIKALATEDSQPAATAPSQAQIEPGHQQASPVSATDGNLLWQALSGFLGLGWLLTMVWFFRDKRQKSPVDKMPVVEAARLDQQTALKKACQQNNPHAAKQALLDWGRRQFAADNLTAVADCCSGPLSEEILALNHVLYSGEQQAWDGEALWRAFSKQDSTPNKNPIESDTLQPLYRL